MDIQRISLERLKNTRDLGGFKTADGRRIKPGASYTKRRAFQCVSVGYSGACSEIRTLQNC